MSKRVFIICDTETVTDARLVWDVAWIVCDSRGTVLERFNACVSEVMATPFGRKLVARDGFTRRKLADGTRKSDWYLSELDNGTMPLMPFAEIKAAYDAIGPRYGAEPVFCAYNADFDIRVLNDNADSYGLGAFFGLDAITCDIWHTALDTVCNSERFVLWAMANGFISDAGNIRSNAETVYAYIIGATDFEERHTALADCEIERDILFKARKYRKKLHFSNVMPCCMRCPEWKRLQARYK
jgi:hypothetical protein